CSCFAWRPDHHERRDREAHRTHGDRLDHPRHRHDSMVLVRTMLRFEDALARILALGAPPLERERVAIEDADGRVLAEDLLAEGDLPAFDYSAMDGYALAIADLDGAPPYRLPVHGESRTGAVPEPLAARTTMRIFTGAPLPAGADTVVMQENVAREGSDA